MMTVAQLIEALRALPKDAAVILTHEMEGQSCSLDSSCIRTCKAGEAFGPRTVHEYGLKADDSVVLLEM